MMATSFEHATTLYEQGKLREALPHFLQALEDTRHSDINVLYRCMLTLVAMRDYTGAAKWIEGILAHIDVANTNPRLMAEFYYNLGCCFETLGQWEQAKRNHTNSLAFHDLTLPYVNLGSIAYRQGDPMLGLEHHARAMAEPDVTDWEIQAGRSFVWLLHGHYEQGFKEYEARWSVPGVKAQSYLPTSGKRWAGEPLDGKSILLIGEQGLGDQLMMLRYLPVLQAMGAQITLLVAAGLKRLVQHHYPGVKVIQKGEPMPKPPRYWIHLLSLPHRLGTTIDTIPPAVCLAPIPGAGPTLASPGPRVGLVTKGNALHMSDKDRSMPPEQATALRTALTATGATVVSLHEDDLKRDHSIAGFHDTAAVLTQLDCLVSIDSAAAHLAGCLGVPVLLMPPCAPEWRWGLTDTAPWYPDTHQIFRRTSVDAWDDVIERVVRAVR